MQTTLLIIISIATMTLFSGCGLISEATGPIGEETITGYTPHIREIRMDQTKGILYVNISPYNGGIAFLGTGCTLPDSSNAEVMLSSNSWDGSKHVSSEGKAAFYFSPINATSYIFRILITSPDSWEKSSDETWLYQDGIFVRVYETPPK